MANRKGKGGSSDRFSLTWDSLNRKGKNLESRGERKTDFGGYLLGNFFSRAN